MIVQHQVVSHAEWKAVFDDALATRQSVGETAYRALVDPDDSKSMTGLFQWDTVGRARAFAADPFLENGMQGAGVISSHN